VQVFCVLPDAGERLKRLAEEDLLVVEKEFFKERFRVKP